MQTFIVEGMNCGHCVSVVAKAVRKIDPDAHVDADPATGKVEVESKAGRDQLAAAMEKAGYPVADQNKSRPEATM